MRGWINSYGRFYRSQLIQLLRGLNETDYCPSTAVNRGQMAVFVAKTFGLSLYGP